MPLVGFNMSNDDCNVPQQLRESIHGFPAEVQQSKYTPQKVGGWKPGEGDTHGDQVLEVPDCM